MNKVLESLAHELWAAAQLAPGEGISDGVARLTALLAQPAEAETLMRWKQTAEYWYGQYRFVKHGESPAKYPTKGKLDDWHNSYHNL